MNIIDMILTHHHVKWRHLHYDEVSERSQFVRCHSFNLIITARSDRYESNFSYYTTIYDLLLGLQ